MRLAKEGAPAPAAEEAPDSSPDSRRDDDAEAEPQ
jgi:hypothetical protein